MTGQELDEHVAALGEDHDIGVLVVLTAKGVEGQALLHDDGRRSVLLTATPSSSVEAYLVALHEIGHHAADAMRGYRLDMEAAAWRWALKHTRIPVGPSEWRHIRDRLLDYALDRRMKHTPNFIGLLAEATKGAA